MSKTIRAIPLPATLQGRGKWGNRTLLFVDTILCSRQSQAWCGRFEYLELCKMKIELYDRVVLKNGNIASIVEILAPDKEFIVDIGSNGDINTEEISIEEIESVF